MYDLTVAGAGLAGLEVSRRLATRGLRVLLLDRKESLAAPVHTTGIFVRKTWEDFPLPDAQFGSPIRDVVLYSPSRRPLRLTANHNEFRVGQMSWIYLWLIERCTRAGVVWRPASRLVGCEASGKGSRLTIARRGRHEVVETRFVIGADGARSSVATHLGLDTNREFLTGIEEIREVPRTEASVLHCYLDPLLAPGYIAWVVIADGEAHVGVAGRGARFCAAASLTEFQKSLGDTFAFGRTIERRGGLIPVNGILRRIANERGVLVGDAAGAVSPLTAGGLDGAMRLSRFAAGVVFDYLSTGDPAGLAHYSGDRFRSRFIARRWMRRALDALSTPAAMELACALLRTTPLRRIAEHLFFSRGSFPDVEWRGRLQPAERRAG